MGCEHDRARASVLDNPDARWLLVRRVDVVADGVAPETAPGHDDHLFGLRQRIERTCKLRQEGCRQHRPGGLQDLSSAHDASPCFVLIDGRPGFLLYSPGAE